MNRRQEAMINVEKVEIQDRLQLGDRVPESWSPEHVAKRLVDAFAALDRCPRVRGPRGPGNTWPSAAASDRLDVDLDFNEATHYRHMAPTGSELARMDAALEWLRWLRHIDSGMALVTGLWAYNAARGRSIKNLCQRRSWALHTFYRKRGKALALIAQYLENRGTPVF